MALIPSSYTKPGVYIGEVLVPGSVAFSSERSLCIIATAPRTRRVINEAVIRGKVFEEALSSWELVTSFYETELVNISNRDRNNSILYKNGNKVPLGSWFFRPAFIRGIAVPSAQFTTTTAHRFSISLDGKAALQIDVTAGVNTPVATIATDINAALVASPLYGAAYASVATTIQTTVPNDTLVLTSPVSTSASDVVLYFPFEVSATHLSCLAGLFGPGAFDGMVPVPTSGSASRAKTVVRVSNSAFSSTASYTIDYITVQTQVDPLVEATTSTPLTELVSASSFPSSNNYLINRDFEKTGNNIDWSIAGVTEQANFTGIPGTYAIVGGTSDVVKFSINGRDPITLTLTAGGARTAAQIAAEINEELNDSATYGPEFAYVASDSAGSLKLTVPSSLPNFTPSRGAQSSITFYEPAASSAMAILFGLSSTALPYSVSGTGNIPVFGSVYYVTYDFTRPASDYDRPFRVFDPSSLIEFTSPLTDSNYIDNTMAVAGLIAFENQANSILLQLIDDSTSPGEPTSTQIKAAIDKCALSSAATDLVVIEAHSDEADIAAYLMNHVSNQSSYLNKKYRRGWYGMARDTDIGDPDTPDTFVFRSTVTLQPSGVPGRGRHILVAPANASRTLTLSDGSEVTVELDSTYVACAIAALFTSLPSVSDALIGRQIVGFNSSDFQTYTDGEFKTLAGNGVTVVTSEGGVLKLEDPITTEAGGGKVVQFEEPQSSAAKDSITRAIDLVLDSNLKGVVPDELSSFIIDIKVYIANALSSKIQDGSIASYRDATGFPRSIDLTSDIKVAQSLSDPRTFTFKYWFNLKYPAKRFFGEYSVDNPFFGA
jgi:hypothetical protein